MFHDIVFKVPSRYTIDPASVSFTKKILVITGPTAVGKSALLRDVKPHMDGPFISADSRQIYKEMRIGTAKPDPEEIAALDIKLVDQVSIHEHYHAGRYEREALALILPALEDGQIPVVSGGTGLYIKAIAEGLDDIPAVDPSVIQQLNQEAEEQMRSLVEELKQKDPQYHMRIDLSNRHRVLRALGVIRQTGQAYSSFLGKVQPRPFEVKYVILERTREALYERINERVLQMMEAGLMREAESLFTHRKLKALQTVGYTELFRHMEGELSLDEAVSEIQKNTRRYAKRQMTWFRNQVKADFIHPDDKESLSNQITRIKESQ